MFVEEGGTLGQGAYVCFGLGEGGGGEGWSSYSQGIPRLTVCSLSLIFSSLHWGERRQEKVMCRGVEERNTYSTYA
jgi:hypothetical protein